MTETGNCNRELLNEPWILLKDVAGDNSVDRISETDILRHTGCIETKYKVCQEKRATELCVRQVVRLLSSNVAM